MLRKLTDTLSSALKRRPSAAAPPPAQLPPAATRPEDRVELLVEAGRALSASLDYQQTLQNLAQLVLHRFADYCLIFELLDPPAMRQVASSHVDPRKAHLPKRLGELYGVFPENPRLSLWRVARSGKSELVPHSTLEMAQAVAQDPEILTLYQRLQAGSFMVLPLAARGQTLGVMLLATAESGRIFGPEDLGLGEEIAFRAGLAIDNARLYRQAQDASRAKDDFLATISHELRTPLTPVLLTASSLLQSPKLHDSLRDEVEMIERNVELEAKLIDDLLDLTRIARGQIKAHFEVRDVHRLLADVVGLCRDQIREKEIQVAVVTAAAEHHVWGDAARLQQIFWNIMQNAVKFSPRGARIEVSTASAAGRLRVDIRDEGVGIAPEVLTRLFQAFEQGDHHRSRSFGGGLGLGLAIAKGLVDLHGGSLSVVQLRRRQGLDVHRLPDHGAGGSPLAARPAEPGAAGGPAAAPARGGRSSAYVTGDDEPPPVDPPSGEDSLGSGRCPAPRGVSRLRSRGERHRPARRQWPRSDAGAARPLRLGGDRSERLRHGRGSEAQPGRRFQRASGQTGRPGAAQGCHRPDARRSAET